MTGTPGIDRQIRQIDRQTDRKIDSFVCTESNVVITRTSGIDRYTDRQIDRQIDIQIDRQIVLYAQNPMWL